jgi:COP9 signalosome complex subunit 5
LHFVFFSLPYSLSFLPPLFLCSFQVMGLLIGRPSTDPKNLNAMIVTDAFPLPVEGVETRVEAGAEAMMSMVALSETIEVTREERIMGWYHSHPFDVSKDPQYFFSNTDCQNQVVWQRGNDPYGDPFLGIVIDPLRSIAKGRPEMGSFRAFLPAYSQTVPMAPDGTLVTSANKSAIMERWGNTWNRYYMMDTQFFMSDLTKRMVDILAKNFTWISVLSVSLKNDVEYRQQLAQRIGKIATTIGGSMPSGVSGSSSSSSSSRSSSRSSSSSGGGGGASSSTAQTGSSPGQSKLVHAESNATELGMEQRVSGYTQIVKEAVFSRP